VRHPSYPAVQVAGSLRSNEPNTPSADKVQTTHSKRDARRRSASISRTPRKEMGQLQPAPLPPPPQPETRQPMLTHALPPKPVVSSSTHTPPSTMAASPMSLPRNERWSNGNTTKKAGLTPDRFHRLPPLPCDPLPLTQHGHVVCPHARLLEPTLAPLFVRVAPAPPHPPDTSCRLTLNCRTLPPRITVRPNCNRLTTSTAPSRQSQRYQRQGRLSTFTT
jgi:hypothetical protein